MDILRRAGSLRRATIASDLTNSALARARGGIERAHPEMSDLDRKLLFVEVHYGRALADRLREWLQSRGRDGAS
jgi:hypothetical protein